MALDTDLLGTRIMDLLPADTFLVALYNEFTVLLTTIRGEDAIGIVMDKIRAVFEAAIVLPARSLTLTTSIGAALYPAQGISRDQLTRHADAEMYAAKRAKAAPGRQQR